MTPERWAQVEELFHRAAECEARNRAALLNQTCHDDPELRLEVEALLHGDQDVTDDLQVAVQNHLGTVGFPLIGETISHYRILKGLAGGGMGLVYVAEDLKLGRLVALKFLPEDAARNPEALKRFEREAQSASALEHPNICPIYEFGDHEGQPFLVMPLLEGQTLRELISVAGPRKPPLPLDKLLDLAIQIASGLEAAHGRGIIHRDIKPANIFVANQGQAKILDFGLAKLAGASSTTEDLQTNPSSEGADGKSSRDGQMRETPDPFLSRTGMAMGTAGYMSPEQARGERLDARTDLFSFGLVLYELATGQHAFAGDTGPALPNAILQCTPAPVRQFNPKLPGKFETIIRKALERDRARRYQSASELRADLQTVQEALAPAKKLPWSVWMVAILALLFLAGVTNRFVNRNSSPALPDTPVSQVKATHKQFTSLGNAYVPAISPDGNFVAYIVRKAGEKNRLMVQARDGTTLELAQKWWIQDPRWSPDGSELLFDDGGISVVSRLGGVPRAIGTGGHACWMAGDGSQVATALASESPAFHGFRIINVQSGEVKKVPLPDYTFLQDLDCSPKSGLILVVARTSEKYQILVYKPDGSGQRKLVEEEEDISAARWSPMGDAIYYLHRKGETEGLSKISVSIRETQSVLLVEGLQTGGYFTLAADGSRLAYTRLFREWNLWRVKSLNTNGSSKQQVSPVTSGTRYFGTPSFSPDGRWIAYAAGTNEDSANIFKMPASGGNQVQLTFFEHVEAASPAWSPDGQRIAFICNQSGTPKVWEINARGGSARAWETTDASNTNARLAWWPSDDVIYQQQEMRNYLRINERTREERPVLQSDQSTGWVPERPVFSRDGKKMAVYWNRRDRGAWVVSLEPYSETLLLTGETYPIGWSPDGKFVYAIRAAIHQGREIIKIQVATPHDTTLEAALPGDFMPDDAASVSPDGREIIVRIKNERSDVWLMENFDPAENQAGGQLRKE